MGLLQLFQADPTYALFFFAWLLIGITVHEAAHSWTASKLGDPTPEIEGRVTLDPLAHIDPLGVVAMLLIGFGWGRPAPFNPSYFKHYKRDTALTAIGGPVSNFLLVIMAVIVVRILGSTQLDLLLNFFGAAIAANLILAVFNLIPVPPLDGSKIVYALLPERYEHIYHQAEQLGPYLIILIFLFSGAFFAAIYQPILHFALQLAGAA